MASVWLVEAKDIRVCVALGWAVTSRPPDGGKSVTDGVPVVVDGGTLPPLWLAIVQVSGWLGSRVAHSTHVQKRIYERYAGPLAHAVCGVPGKDWLSKMRSR